MPGYPPFLLVPALWIHAFIDCPLTPEADPRRREEELRRREEELRRHGRHARQRERFPAELSTGRARAAGRGRREGVAAPSPATSLAQGNQVIVFGRACVPGTDVPDRAEPLN